VLNYLSHHYESYLENETMRGPVFLAVILASFFVNSCGSKDDSAGDYYQSCQVSKPVNGIDVGYCIEAKNATDLKVDCEKESGTYAQTQCDATTGVKGCSYKNSKGAELIDWYTGSAWTRQAESEDCALPTKTNGTIITK
jgi:hypothetical protein